MTQDLACDWEKLLDAAGDAIDRCEVALRIVAPFFEERVGVAEQDELELTVRLLKSLRRKFAAGGSAIKR
jgi:hypothetical protein